MSTMNDSYEAINSRLIHLESCLTGISEDLPCQKQLTLQIHKFKEFLNNNKFLTEFTSNLKRIGIYDELEINDSPSTYPEASDELSIEDKRTVIEVNLNSLEKFLNMFDDLLMHANKLNDFEKDYEKILELTKLSSMTEIQYHDLLDQYASFKKAYNAIIVRSIKILELNLIQVYEQNKFYTDIESKLSDLDSRLQKKYELKHAIDDI